MHKNSISDQVWPFVRKSRKRTPNEDIFGRKKAKFLTIGKKSPGEFSKPQQGYTVEPKVVRWTDGETEGRTLKMIAIPLPEYTFFL